MRLPTDLGQPDHLIGFLAWLTRLRGGLTGWRSAPARPLLPAGEKVPVGWMRGRFAGGVRRGVSQFRNGSAVFSNRPPGRKPLAVAETIFTNTTL